MKKSMALRLGILALLLAICINPASALNVDITNITIHQPDTMQVAVRVQVDVPGIPYSAFTITDAGQTMVLDSTCGNDIQGVDVVFALDISKSMESNIAKVADSLISWIGDITDENPAVDFRFGVVLYGQIQWGTSCGVSPSYEGAPKNYTTPGLGGLWTDVHTQHFIDSLAYRSHNPDVLRDFVGGQEAGYDAIYCAINGSAWRLNSERYIVLVSDENRDTCRTGSHGLIPVRTQAELITQMQTSNTHFYAWAMDSVLCDCYDFCPPGPEPCNFFVYSGCTSGVADYGPIAAATGGGISLIYQPITSLLNIIGGRILLTRTICYTPACCYVGIPQDVEVCVTWGGPAVCDDTTYTRTACPTGTGGPVVDCWVGNPTNYVYGQNLTVCATVSAPSLPLTGVTAKYVAGVCQPDFQPVSLVDGRYCITIPGSCLTPCPPVQVIFRAGDECHESFDTCWVYPPNHAPTITAWTGNPTTYTWGSPFSICVNVTDADVNDLLTVTAVCTGCACDDPLVGTFNAATGRWCIPIPANCTYSCSNLSFLVTVRDCYGLTGTVTIPVTFVQRPPVITCWSGNPTTFTYGQPVTLCATITDPDGNLNGAQRSVNARYRFGTCDVVVAPVVDVPNNRYCVTVPASCTQYCGSGKVYFTAIDDCGGTTIDSCSVTNFGGPPVVTCYTSNPSTYCWGEALTMCAIVTDPCNSITSVTATITGTTCTMTNVPASLTAGRWCVAIPANCTRTCNPLSVTFTAISGSGQTGTSAACPLISRDGPPVQTPWASNPTSYLWGQPLSLCMTVADPCNNLATVTARVIGCGSDIPAVLGSGRWCATIPATCTRSCSVLDVVFTSLDSCGYMDRDTLHIPSGDLAPVQACYSGNPATFCWGQALNVDVTVTDANLATVTANVIGCGSAITVTPVGGGRYSAAIPAACTRLCAPQQLQVAFAATDSCGHVDRDTCRINNGDGPPVQACYTGNPTTFVWGQPLSMCVTVTDPCNNLATVTAQVIGCGTVIPATLGSGRWCATIPATCTRSCTQLAVVFTSTDSCGLLDRDTCRVNSDNVAPVQACYTGNPATYTWGQTDLSMCVTVTDVNLATVTGKVVGCGTDIPAVLSSGRWCFTVPASCTHSCAQLAIAFTATDSCGLIDRDTCRVNSANTAPVQACYSSNPATYTWGQSNLSMCVTVTDANLATVVGKVVGCGNDIPAVFASGRWCFTVPQNCTRACGPLAIAFTATDSCGLIDRDTCRVTIDNPVPVQSCWSGNPTTYNWGDAITMCATVTDANLATVTAKYIIGNCTVTVPAVFNTDRWCATIPPTCTSICTTATMIFTATDSCGLFDRDTCRIVRISRPPVISCFTGNPTSYLWNQPLTVCAVASDPDNDITSVTATYTVGAVCVNQPGTVSPVDGRYCMTIPASCMAQCDTARVTFTVTDGCQRTASTTCTINPPGRSAEIGCSIIEGVTYEADTASFNIFMFATPEDVKLCVELTSGNIADIDSVAAIYNLIGTVPCLNQRVTPVFDPGLSRWCVVIPPECAPMNFNAFPITFIAYTPCGNDTAVCWARILIPLNFVDLGDLPNPPYPTNSTIPIGLGGPSHVVGNAWLGTSVDFEPAPFQDGGELLGSEDNGFVKICEAQGDWSNCTQIEIPIIVHVEPGFTEPLYLSGWFDENNDGDFTDQFTCNGVTFYSEWFIPDVIVHNGVNNITVVVSHTSPDDTARIHLRLRLDNHPFGANGFEDIGDLPVAPYPNSWPRFNGEVEDYYFKCTPIPPCCQYCVMLPPVGLTGAAMEYDAPLNAVLQFKDNVLKLAWTAQPGIEYYNILRGDIGDPESMKIVGTALAGETMWRETTPLSALPDRAIYQVQPMHVVTDVSRALADKGQWEMNEGVGDYALDNSGNGMDAWRAQPCPPTWGTGAVDTCGHNIGYMHFEGFTGHPGCAEHLEVANDDQWYQDRFLLWTCLRIFEEPTVQTGAYYIISNNSFGTMHGGFALRIDPGWFTVNGVREYHNRLTALVWNEASQSWMTIQSPPPQPSNPGKYSVPLNEWVEIAWIINGANSMLLINRKVVAVGPQFFDSNNNGAPLIIGAGYRHNTYPIEYPFRGDIDCLRIVGDQN